MERQRPDARPAKKPDARPKEEKQLDKALEETFPSSDPVSITVPEKEKEWTPEELAEADRRKSQRSKTS